MDDKRRAEAEQQALLVGASMGEDMKSMRISNGNSVKAKMNWQDYGNHVNDMGEDKILR